MTTNKQFTKLQASVSREAAGNLTGACKLYASLSSNISDLSAVCKGLDIPKEAAVKVATLAKNRNRLVLICTQMLPKVGNTFVKLSLCSKEYKDKKENAVKGVKKDAQWLADNAIEGSSFKAFGFASPVEYKEAQAFYVSKDTDTYRATYAWTPIRTYTVRLVAKCVTEFLSHESED